MKDEQNYVNQKNKMEINKLTQKAERNIKRVIKRAVFQYTSFSPSVRNEVAEETINALKFKIKLANTCEVDLKKVNTNLKRKKVFVVAENSYQTGKKC